MEKRKAKKRVTPQDYGLPETFYGLPIKFAHGNSKIAKKAKNLEKALRGAILRPPHIGQIEFQVVEDGVRAAFKQHNNLSRKSKD